MESSLRSKWIAFLIVLSLVFSAALAVNMYGYFTKQDPPVSAIEI